MDKRSGDRQDDERSSSPDSGKSDKGGDQGSGGSKPGGSAGERDSIESGGNLFRGTERLDSLDLKGAHVVQYPAEVLGRFRTARSRVYFVLLVIFLVLPWVRLGGHQAVLLNIPERRFAFFGITFWAHDGPIVFFVLGILAIGLAFITALWGRLWCGWACPQTVFIDTVFRRIEIWLEGGYVQRRRASREPLTGPRALKKAIKWALYFVVSLVISHSFMAYFVGTESLAEMMKRSPMESWTAFSIMAFITVIIMFDFGWFREQFCVIVCPYGRFQSVLMDENSLTILYDESRGEPRKAKGGGDCIACNKCVRSCPTGIDIRNGVQMECIACTACIDACDEVMLNMNKPRGLIRYESLASIAGRPRRTWSPRRIIYLGLMTASFLGLVLSVMTRKDLDITVVRAVERPYELIPGQADRRDVINHFKIHLKNSSFEVAEVAIMLPDELQAEGYSLISPQQKFLVRAGGSEKPHIFLRFPEAVTKGVGQRDIALVVHIGHGSRTLIERRGVRIIGPN